MHDTDYLAQTFEAAPDPPDGASPTACSARRARPTTRSRRPGSGSAARMRSRSTTSAAWLTTVLSRVCLNMLQARRSRPEVPLGVERPEPATEADPEHEALLADSIGLALLVVLDTLTPAERVAFVLHDMFGVPFEEIAPIVGPQHAGHPPAGEPSAPPRPARGRGRRGEPAPARQAGRRLPRRRPQRRVRAAARRPRPRRRAPRRPDRGGHGHRARRSAGSPRSARSHAAPAAPPRRSSTARPPRCGSWAGSRASSTASRPATRRSPASSSSPTRSACARSTS